MVADLATCCGTQLVNEANGLDLCTTMLGPLSVPGKARYVGPSCDLPRVGFFFFFFPALKRTSTAATAVAAPHLPKATLLMFQFPRPLGGPERFALDLVHGQDWTQDC